MPPKKSKATASSSSQPVLQPTRQSGRKRKGSDASQISDVVASSQDTTAAKEPAKKRKKGRPTKSQTSQQPDVIVEEVEELFETEPQSDVSQGLPTTSGAEEDEILDDIEVGQPKHVHFGAEEISVEDGERTTATNITPHPRKMSIKRRVSTSPSVLKGATSKRVRISSSRPSLPHSLSMSIDGASEVPVRYIQDYQYSPLSEVLAERIRTRLLEGGHKRESSSQQELEILHQEAADREERIQELESELETQKELAAAVTDEEAEENLRLRELEGELLALKRQEHRAIAQLRRIDGPDDQMLVLHNSQEKIEYPDLPTPSTSRSGSNLESPNKDLRLSQAFGEGASQITISRVKWESERHKFEDAVMTLSREANEAKAALRVLEIELEALGFTEEGASTSIIMQSIRDSFMAIREDLGAVLPASLPDDASNGDLIRILIANVKEFVVRLQSQDTELQDKTTLANDLRNQVSGLLDHLADAEIRKAELEGQWREMDHENDKKDRRITELENEADSAFDERDELQVEFKKKTEELMLLGQERDEMFASVEKLAASLERYRQEETRLTELITRMEEEHREGVIKMNQEREETVNDLEVRLDAMTEAKENAEDTSDERRRAIDDLEAKIEVLEDLRDDLTEKLEKTRSECDEEKESREKVEGELRDQVAETEDLEERVAKLEQELTSLNATLEELRHHNESERTQREAAEQDLDDRNIEIDDISKKLTIAGQEANELRMQLFGKQQEHESLMKELEVQMTDRDQQYQSDMSEEVSRRNEADSLAQERAATILVIERQLEELEVSMREQVTTRDERISELEAIVLEREREVSNLQAELARTGDELKTQTVESRQRTEDLEESISVLQQTISEHEVTITTLRLQVTQETEQHSTEMEDRNAAISGLNATITALQAQVDDLDAQRISLERRVEEEASQMLQLQGEKDDEITELRNIIADKQAKIMAVEVKADEADKAWQAVLGAREEELQMMQTQGVQTAQMVSAVRTENLDIKNRFRAYVRRSIDTIARLREELERVRSVADEEDAQLQALGEGELEAIESMNAIAELETVVTQTATMTTSTTTQSSSSKAVSAAVSSGASGKKGRGRKKRVMDSGIGMEGEE